MAQSSPPNQQDMEVDLRRQLNDVFGEFDQFADLVGRQLFGVIPTPGVMRGLIPYSTNRIPSNASIPSASLCLQEMKNVPPLIPPLHLNRNDNQNAGCASEASSSHSHMNDDENYNGRKKRKRDRSEEDSDGPLKRREKKEDNKMMRDLFDDDIDDEKGDWKGSGFNNTPPPEIRMMVLGMQVDPLIPPYDTDGIKKKDDDEREKEDRERKRKKEDSERRRKEKNEEEERKKKRDEDEERKRKKDDEEDRRRRRDDEEIKRRKEEDDKRRKRDEEEREKERKRKDDEERDRETKRKELDGKRKKKEELEKEEEERRIRKEKKKLEKEERKRKEEEERMKDEERERKKKEKDEEKRRLEEEEIKIKKEKENREREELTRRIEEEKKRESERIRQEEEDKKKELERIRKDEMRNREVEEKRKRDDDERKKKEDEDRMRKEKKKEDEDRMRKEKKKEEEKRRWKDDEKEKKKKDDHDRGKRDREKKGSLPLNTLSNSKLEAVLEAEKERRKRETGMSESKDERISLWNDSKKKNWKDDNGREKKRKDADRIMKKEGSSALSSPMSSKNSSRVATPIPPLPQPSTSIHQNVCSPSSSVHLFSFPHCPSSSCCAARLVPLSPPSLEQRTDNDGYTNYAKEKKHNGDASMDRNIRFFYYLESSMYFAFSVSSCDPFKSSDRELSMAGGVLKDTVDLIKHAMVLFEKEGIAHLLSRAKILCIRTQAVLNYHMYVVRSNKFPRRSEALSSLESQVQEIPKASPKKEERNSIEKGEKNIGTSSSANSIASSSNMVTMPMSLWKMKSSQVSTYIHLEYAHGLWNESNKLMPSNEKHYWNTIDNLILHSFDWGCPLHVGSSLLHLCTFINTTVSWMRMEYEAEKGK